MVGIYRSYGAKFISWLWFYKDAAPDGAGGDSSGGIGAETQWLFLPEPDTGKTRLTRAGKQAWKSKASLRNKRCLTDVSKPLLR